MQYIKAKEAAKVLKISVTALNKLKDHPDDNKKLVPVNALTYRGDGGYVYLQSDVERIKPFYTREDLTSAEAAKRIGRSTTFIHKLIREGLPHSEGELRGKKTYFIKEADLVKYVSDNPDSGKYDTIYDKATGAYLFQLFEKDGKLGRIVRMKKISSKKKEITLQLAHNEILSYENAIEAGWLPKQHISDKKAITSYGYAKFIFPLPPTLDSIIYSIIEELFQQAGPKNMRITTADQIVVEVKKCVLLDVLPSTHPDLIDKLKMFIRTGEIVNKYDGTLIDTGLAPITFYIADKMKLKLIEKAAANNQTLQEWLEDQFSMD
ncbi:helix-turn-helix domain-containing protein [Paenibacillus sp. MMO-58]|uniref:helix-turn-helix domain-containing protein n=1 Tax=Paenibacillus sp. MMO-58 TaxID=3081290 RepID=UPI0030176348